MFWTAYSSALNNLADFDKRQGLSSAQSADIADQAAENTGYDLTHDLTRGSISDHFRNMAVPMAIGMVFSTLYNIVDTFYAGLISTDAQAGLAIASQVFFFVIALGFGISSAMGALVGNAFGEAAPKRANRITRQGVFFSFLVSVILTLAGIYFTPEIVSLISTDSPYRSAANNYLGLVLLGTVFFIPAYAVNGVLQARGDTRSMKRAQVAAFFANLVLNPLFIFGIPGLIPGFGFNGLALSTLVSQAGVMVYILYRLYRSGVFDQSSLSMLVKPDWQIYRAILGQALPSSFSMMVMIASGFIVQFFLKNFGPEAVAAYGIAIRIEQLLLLPVFGLTGSLMPIVAQNYGAGQFDRIRQATFFCFRFGCSMMILSGFLLWFLGAFVLSFFTDNDQVIAVGSGYLRMEALIQWVYLMLFAINSLLQALKKPVWILWIGIYRQAIGIALFSYIYVQIFNFGVWGVWLGIATSVLTGLILSILIAQYLSKKLIGGLFFYKEEKAD